MKLPGVLKNLIFIFITFSLVFSQGILASSEESEITIDIDSLAEDDQMLDTFATTKPELNALLSRGALGKLVFEDVNGLKKNSVDIIWETAQKFSLNPRFITVLLQREQSLVEDRNPTTDQLDWAMGYAVCDSCSKSDPQIQKYKGFANQIYFAAKRIRESYLSDLEERGFTESGVGPGIEAWFDGVKVVPQNLATSVLYTYTPHLNGNQNFARIWDRWFNYRHVNGTLLQDKTTGGIWLVQNGLRRPITSRAAFFSRFNSNSVIQVGPSTLELYKKGTPIRFPNYSLLRSPRGTVYLIVNDKRRGFTSQEAFRALGFSTDEIIDVTFEDLEAYSEGEPIDTKTIYPKGTLLQNNKTGGVFFVQNGKKRPIFSKEILKTNFLSPSLTLVSETDLDAYETAEPLLFPDGTLVAKKESPEIFVISDGQRKHISDEATFVSMGWKWNQIVWTNERSILLHPLSESVDTTLENNNQGVRIAEL
ncbi:hypothetical protein HY771_02705 [Candidatus Uhrbacteria bacterium]|nr:hypothetical protein [Candidatus Uhrbacteria bacterium]